MKIMGISMGFHDAAVSVIDQGEILFAHTQNATAVSRTIPGLIATSYQKHSHMVNLTS